MRHFDLAVVNIPLAKRGNIDAQIDRFKRAQAVEAKAAAKAAARQKREDKKLARQILAQHLPAIVEKHGAKFGKQPLTDMLTGWAKWEPEKLFRFVNKFIGANDDRSHEVPDRSLPF